jgi:DNA adenine methylase
LCRHFLSISENSSFLQNDVYTKLFTPSNVPFGRYTNPNILDSENIKACAIALKHSEIHCSDFTYVQNKVCKGDFVYFDPPYYPVNETSNFTNYTKLGFGEDMQVRLKELCDYIHNVGAYFMLSNSYTPTILKLYDSKKYNHTEVHASRAINCKATGRGKIKELVIRNY